MSRPEVSFFTEGDQRQHKGSYYVTNQAYVQYIPPALSNGTDTAQVKLPLLFVHGGGLTGANWESTPDRRPGWAVLASRAPNYRPVYVIDAVDSGRSQRCDPSLRLDETVEHRTAGEVWERFRIGSRQSFESGERALFAGSQFPLEAFDALVTAQSARRRSVEQDTAEINGLTAAVREIGPCQIVAHSNGGAVVCEALRRNEDLRELVEKVVLVEPSRLVEEVPIDIGAVKTMILWGDYLDKMYARMRGLIQAYEKSLPEPYLVNLPQLGIKGNTHFPMCDRNSAEIAVMAFDWLGRESP